MQLPCGQAGADSAQDLAEERITEDAPCRLGDHDADRVAATGHERPGGDVGDEPEAVDRSLDQLLRRRVDPGLPLTTRETVA